MSHVQKYWWELTHVTGIAGVITIMTLAAHLTGTPRIETPPTGNVKAIGSGWRPFPYDLSAPSDSAAHPAQVSSQQRQDHRKSLSQHLRASMHPSDPRVIVVGPRDISNRYTLLGVDRKPVSPALAELTVKLRVESLAMEPLVTPFESDMLELHDESLQPIKPMTPFHHPVPGGNSLNQDVVFSIPTEMSLSNATLKIHYYNYQAEIPLKLSPPDSEK